MATSIQTVHQHRLTDLTSLYKFSPQREFYTTDEKVGKKFPNYLPIALSWAMISFRASTPTRTAAEVSSLMF